LSSLDSPTQPNLFNLDVSLSYEASPLTNATRQKQVSSQVSSAIPSKRGNSRESSPFSKEQSNRSKVSEQRKPSQRSNNELEDYALRESKNGSKMNTIREESNSSQRIKEFIASEKSKRMGTENQNPRESLKLDDKKIKESGFKGTNNKNNFDFQDDIASLPRNEFENDMRFEKEIRQRSNNMLNDINREEDIRYSIEGHNPYRKSFNQSRNSFQVISFIKYVVKEIG